MTEQALALRAPVLGNVTVERLCGRDRLLRLRQPALKPLPARLTLNGLPQRSKLPLVQIGRGTLEPDLGLYVFEGVLVRFAAEDENLVTGLAGPLVLIGLVVV